ncbi:MAG TPA: hypothetical protein VHI13_20905 [Candidatus Kapabacteria bacterium]|nr:hypothetical protein [Candidatus Kapabacteria bacterium]
MTTRTKAILSLGSVFLLGGICGALIFGMIVRNQVRESQTLRDSSGFVDYFARRLELTEAQRDSLRGELEHTYTQLAQLRASATEQYNEVLDSLRQHIYPHLNDRQQELFRDEEHKFRRYLPKDEMPRGLARNGQVPRSGDVATSVQPQPRHDSPAVVQQAPANAPEKREAAATSKTLPPIDPAQARTTDVDGLDLPDEPSQKAGQGTDRPSGHFVQELRERLKLTPDQQKRVVAILTGAGKDIRSIRADMNDTPVLMRTAIRERRQQMLRDIGILLTPEQREAFKEYLRTRREERGRPLQTPPH